ncbi:MAG: hypothetical protein HY718_04565 [Planctomycetes bacterium]|nr:hypothetical protein [Planctomycetota bacterium]
MSQTLLPTPPDADDGAPPSPPSGAVARPVVDPACPLTEAQFQLIRQAVAAHQPIRKAARIARKSALSILAVGVLAVPFLVLSPGFSTLIVTVTLCGIGYLEHLGARKMSRGLPSAASHLGWNQVTFICLIVVYCIDAMLGPPPSSSLSPQVRAQLSQVGIATDQIDSLVSALTYVVYSAVILLSVTLQGMLAWYYFTRRRWLEDLQRSTPPWIRRLLDELAA